jgi:hypothetical protein
VIGLVLASWLSLRALISIRLFAFALALLAPDTLLTPDRAEVQSPPRDHEGPAPRRQVYTPSPSARRAKPPESATSTRFPDSNAISPAVFSWVKVRLTVSVVSPK